MITWLSWKHDIPVVKCELKRLFSLSSWTVTALVMQDDMRIMMGMMMLRFEFHWRWDLLEIYYLFFTSNNMPVFLLTWSQSTVPLPQTVPLDLFLFRKELLGQMFNSVKNAWNAWLYTWIVNFSHSCDWHKIVSSNFPILEQINKRSFWLITL